MFDDIERRRSETERHLENKGRLAHVFARYRTTGSGTHEFDKRVDFGLIYVEQPYMTYGSQIDPEAVNALYAGSDDADDALDFPQCTGYVTEWDVDERGYYVGAWLAASVMSPSLIVTDYQFEIAHMFSFAAVAIKSFPAPDED